MDCLIHIDIIGIDLSILYFKGSQVLANSADPDKMLLIVAFHLGIHCLPKYLFVGIQNKKSQLGFNSLCLVAFQK